MFSKGPFAQVHGQANRVPIGQAFHNTIGLLESNNGQLDPHRIRSGIDDNKNLNFIAYLVQNLFIYLYENANILLTVFPSDFFDFWHNARYNALKR